MYRQEVGLPDLSEAEATFVAMQDATGLEAGLEELDNDITE